MSKDKAVKKKGKNQERKKQAIVPVKAKPAVNDGQEKYVIPEVMMDGTAITEISLMANDNFSRELVSDVKRTYGPKRMIRLLEKGNTERFYQDGKEQILRLWRNIQAMTTHANLFVAAFLIDMGNVLNLIESTFTKKGDYITWIKDNFQTKHSRYFQQAKQLAQMGPFARANAAAGKNRLLSLESLRKTMKKEDVQQIFEEYPVPDTAADQEGELLKLHIDSVITLYRLKNVGLAFVDFSQASIIASIEKQALSVGWVKDVKMWLESFPEEERPGRFDEFVEDKLKLPSLAQQHASEAGPTLSLMITDLRQSFIDANLDDDEWLQEQVQALKRQSVLEVRDYLDRLIERLNPTEAIEQPEGEVTPE